VRVHGSVLRIAAEWSSLFSAQFYNYSRSSAKAKDHSQEVAQNQFEATKPNMTLPAASLMLKGT
jgi:hypothetical protein